MTDMSACFRLWLRHFFSANRTTTIKIPTARRTNGPKPAEAPAPLEPWARAGEINIVIPDGQRRGVAA